MHDEIEVIEQHPLGPVVALDVGRLDAVLGQRIDDAVRDGANLTRVGAGANQKEVGEPGRLPQIEPMILLIDALTADVSSTAIRNRVAAGDSIDGLVPPGVQQHIEQHGLYTSMTPGRRALDSARGPAAGRLHGQD